MPPTTQNRSDGSLPDHEETTAVRRHRAGHTYRIAWTLAPVTVPSTRMCLPPRFGGRHMRVLG
ncbi:hypothetical protein [Streptomyces guryensis]|uniref:Uncharacterized protein n=1 Tax=Streptomyces guryensis TaxID=2886947 RepID=A0A9Q3VSL2_9ACTN|nr:hypothetical protein [Streptomyces guryensis]MCD9876471.1 hypothetical protein [Streptomyces guryensis]